MARRSLRAVEAEEDDVNVTPLLDIVFIMLIFFIVTSTFIKEPGVQVQRPEVVTGQAKKLISLLVAIDDEDQIWINKKPVELVEVEERVKELRSETPKGVAVVQVDDAAKSKVLVGVLNAMRDAGETGVSVATKQR